MSPPLTLDLAGKYAGYSGFPASQQTSSKSFSLLNPAELYDSYGNIPEDLKKDLIRQEMFNRSTAADTLGVKELLDVVDNPQRRKEILDQQLAYDKARMKEAFPYLMAREIPRQISEGFSNQAALTVLGARSAVDAMNETMRARTPLAFASAPYQSQKYFS